MTSARKFIDKCRRRGFDDERICKSAAGKSAILRDDVIALLRVGNGREFDENHIDSINDLPPATAEAPSIMSVEAREEAADIEVFAEAIAETVEDVEEITVIDAETLPTDIKISFEEVVAIDWQTSVVTADEVTATEIVDNAADAALVDDLTQSQAMLKAAYMRHSPSEYTPPTLTLIDCASEREISAVSDEPVTAEDEPLKISPSYAISPEETAARLAAMDAATAADALRLEAEIFALQQEVYRLKRDLHETQDGCKMLELETAVRHERLTAQNHEIATHEQQVISQAQEIAVYARDLTELRTQNANSENIIVAQSREVTRLQTLLNDVAAGADALVEINRELEREKAAYTTMNHAYAFELGEQQEMYHCAQREINALEAELHATKECLQVAETSLKAMSDDLHVVENARQNAEYQFTALQHDLENVRRERNILQNETVPDLQKDKEDLVTLLGEEVARGEEYAQIISLKSRRLSYTLTAAAAACVAMVLMPIFAWNNYDSQKLELENRTTAIVAQAESVRQTLENERAALHDKMQGMQTALQKVNAERQAWRNQMATLQTALKSSEVELAKLQTLEKSTNREMQAMHGDAGVVHYNEVAGITEWQEKQQTNKNNIPLATPDNNFKLTKVKRGEGLSQVLWRVYGRSSPELVQQITQYNNLATDARGNPLLQVGQELRLPNSQSTAMAGER